MCVFDMFYNSFFILMQKIIKSLRLSVPFFSYYGFLSLCLYFGE